ncbi:MAG: DUF3256 family protein [Bacteroidaceae bacterium]|nr:DUF3256 family protein [Bacteroidaceae bacterium]
MKSLVHIIAIILLATATLAGQAQTVADALKKMPQQLIINIDSIARLDMIDLYKAGMTAQARTLGGDTAHLTILGDTYLHMRTSKASTIQIKLLQQGRKTYYAVITTVEGPVANSHLQLYDASWQTVGTKKKFTPLAIHDFIKTTDKKQRNAIAQEVVLHTIQYTMSEENSNITATPSFLLTLDEETRQRIKPHFHDTVVLQWNGRKWKK